MTHHHKCPAWVGDRCNCPASASAVINQQEQVNAANQAAHNELAAVEREKLNMAASEMLELLREIEWKGDTSDPESLLCPCCEHGSRHAPGCKLAALLARFPR